MLILAFLRFWEEVVVRPVEKYLKQTNNEWDSKAFCATQPAEAQQVPKNEISSLVLILWISFVSQISFFSRLCARKCSTNTLMLFATSISQRLNRLQ